MFGKYSSWMRAITVSLALGIAQNAGAASVTYSLWDSNTTPPFTDGYTYATVTIDNLLGASTAATTTYRFTVEATANPYFDPTKAAIISFGFNTVGNVGVSITSTNWGATVPFTPGSGNQNGFGTFDWTLAIPSPAAGSARQMITFDVTLASAGTFAIFETNSTGGNSTWFATHIQRLVDSEGANACGDVTKTDCSAWFGGGDDEQRPPVPLPATAWLLGSGLLGLLGISRRRKTRVAA